MSSAGGQVQGPLFLPPLSPRRLGPSPSPPVIGRHLPGGRGWLGGGQDRAGQGRAAGRVAAPCRARVQAGVGVWAGSRQGGGLGRAGCPVRYRRRPAGSGVGQGQGLCRRSGSGQGRGSSPGSGHGWDSGRSVVWSPGRTGQGLGPTAGPARTATASPRPPPRRPGPRLAGPGGGRVIRTRKWGSCCSVCVWETPVLSIGLSRGRL